MFEIKTNTESLYSRSSQMEGETLTEKGVRELNLLSEGLSGFADAFQEAITDRRLETIGKVAFSAGVGFALARLSPKAGFGLLVRGAEIGMGTAFLVDVVRNGKQIAGAMADTWQTNQNFNENAGLMRASLGQFGFDSLVMSAGGMAGTRLGSGAQMHRPYLDARVSKLPAAKPETLTVGTAKFPDFTAEGYLPPGVHKLTWPEFSQRFGFNQHRQGLLVDFQEVGGYVKNAGGQEMHVGGSFVTNKPHPKDIDAAWVNKGVDAEAMPPFLVQGKDTALWVNGDYYAADRDFPDIGNWGKALQHTDTGVPKGVVSIDLATLPSKPVARDVVESWRTDNRRAFAEMEATRDIKAQEHRVVQTKADSMVAALPAVIAKGEPSTVAWLGEFAPVNSNTRFDGPAIGKMLMNAGYKPDARIGDPLVQTDHHAFAEWLIGQCLTRLNSRRPVPDFTTKFARQYAELLGQ